MALWVLSGCDEAPGPAPVDRRPPVVQDFAYEVEGFAGRPDSITIADLPADQRTDTTATIRLLMLAELYTLRVFAVDADSLVSNVALGQIRLIPPAE